MRKESMNKYTGRMLSFRDLKNIVSDRDLNLEDRMTALGMAMGVLVGAFGIFTMAVSGVSMIAIILSAVTILILPVFIIFMQRRFQMVLQMKHVITIYIILAMPVFWVSSGGATAGGTLWMLFAIVYISLSHNGKALWFYLGIAFVVDWATFVFGIVCADRLQILPTINRMYINIFLSLMGVGAAIAVGIHLLKSVYIAENKISNERLDELEVLKRDLEDKNHVLENMNENQKRFLAIMAHELRNPLNGIMGYNQMIMKSPDATDEIRSYAAGCFGSSQGLLQIINDILDYSKMDAQKLKICEECYEPRKIAERSVSIFRVAAREKGIQLDLQIDDSVPDMLMGDEMRIQQILTNLVSNAVKYTKQGAVHVTVGMENMQESGQPVLTVSVKDTGDGIDPKGLEVLFTPYTRLKENENKYIQGTGLGLTIVKNLVELMNGTIHVDSQLGIGSVFSVTLPQKRIDQKVMESVGNPKEDIFTDKRVLCVDDMKLNRNLFCMMLQNTGLKIDTASDGETALDMMRKNAYDMIFLDHVMPGMNGVDVLRRIKTERNAEKFPNRNTPVIVFTATVLSGNEGVDFKKEGFCDVLEKPVKYDVLIGFIHKYLDSRNG